MPAKSGAELLCSKPNVWLVSSWAREKLITIKYIKKTKQTQTHTHIRTHILTRMHTYINVYKQVKEIHEKCILPNFTDCQKRQKHILCSKAVVQNSEYNIHLLCFTIFRKHHNTVSHDVYSEICLRLNRLVTEILVKRVNFNGTNKP